MITKSIEWMADVGDDYLLRVAPMIKISSEGNWPKAYPTRVVYDGIGRPRKMWARTSTPQLKEILERVQITQDLKDAVEAAKLRGDL